MTRSRRIVRILSAIAPVIAPACATSVSDDDIGGGVDSGKGDSAVDTGGGGTDSGTTTTPPDDTGVDPDSGWVDPDTGTSDVCTASCTSDSDCTGACASYPGTWCCDPGSSVCFQPSTGQCSGGGGGGDGGGDGGTD